MTNNSGKLRESLSVHEVKKSVRKEFWKEIERAFLKIMEISLICPLIAHVVFEILDLFDW